MPLPATIPLPGGLALPTVGLGTFRARGEEAADAVSVALSAGYRHIDTASIYKNEAEVGAAIAASGIPRDQIFLTTKVSPYQQGSAAAMAACAASAAALGSQPDAVLIHWPGAAKTDAASPHNAELRRETWQALEALHRQGMVRAIGVSNYEQRHLEELLSYAQVPPGTGRRRQAAAGSQWVRHGPGNRNLPASRPSPAVHPAPPPPPPLPLPPSPVQR